jgi:hypothetical protein
MARDTTIEALRKLAVKHPGATEGIACAGTAMERRTIKASNKAFLFFGAKDALLKLRDSLPEASALAAREPTRYSVGAHGWVKATFTADAPPAFDVLARWIGESYQLVASGKPAAKRKAQTRAKRKPATRRTR